MNNQDSFKINCVKCGSVVKTESQINFHEDESATCSCGTKLKFVRDFKNKKNTFSFE